MSQKLYEIISKIMDFPISKINDDLGPESIEMWDSFNGYVLLDELESSYNVKFTLDEALDVKNITDIKRHLKAHGVNFNE